MQQKITVYTNILQRYRYVKCIMCDVMHIGEQKWMFFIKRINFNLT